VYDLNPISFDATIAQASHQRYIQAINVAKALGARYLVLHSQYNPVIEAAHATSSWLDANVNYWSSLLQEVAAENAPIILLENFLDPTPEFLCQIIERVNSPKLKICFDIGHVNLFSKISPLDWMDALGHSVAYIHAHNNYGKFDDHLSFTSGSMNMELILDHAMLLPQPIHLAIEVFEMEGLQDSLKQLKGMLKRQETFERTPCFLL
jgi:sugar phosphate isomerase/epimerase